MAHRPHPINKRLRHFLEANMWAIKRPDATAVLKDKHARASLRRYFAVMENDKPAKFAIAKKCSTSFRETESTSKLWKTHAKLLKQFSKLEKSIDANLERLEELETPTQSFLDLKIEIAKRILKNCHFCSRRCNVDKTKGHLGYCKCGVSITISSIFAHIGEEPELVPSGTIFTLGCTMRCHHCQNWSISQWMDVGEIYAPPHLAAAVELLRKSGCRNANLVGGDPTPWLAQWLETFKHVNVNVPVVWNSNSYYSLETAKLLAGFADVYLLDFKYGNDDCAKRISDAPNYWQACTNNHIYGKKYGELLVRVLVLPEHLDCCFGNILKWIYTELGSTTRMNVMFQYRPEWRANEIPELRRRLTNAEKEKAIELTKRAGLLNFIT